MQVARLGSFVGAVALLLGVGCRSAPPQSPPCEVPGAVALESVEVPEEVRPLWLTVYPTPRLVVYGASLFPLDAAQRIDDASPEFEARLEETELTAGWNSLRREGYVLSVEARNGRAAVLLAARDDAGRRWAEQALAQLTVESGGRTYVRECRIVDWPAFALRGGSRPQAWETRYRANFAWGAKDDADARGRTVAAVYAPGAPLDATGDGVAEALQYFSAFQDRGVRLCAIRLDGQGFSLTPETERRYGGFAPALISYIRLVRQGLRRRDPDARLYLLPQTYAWDEDARLDVLARALADAGGLDPDVGLVVTGPETICDRIDTEGLAQARRAFGLTETRALVEDVGCDTDWGPLTGRDATLALHADGVFGDRGTALQRLTRLDWLWNPTGYDPELSWRRAILELAGPRDYRQLLGICVALRQDALRQPTALQIEEFARLADDAAWRGAMARSELVSQLRSGCSRLTSAPSAAVRGDVHQGD
jgi:beta-N-acetylglucosaminidase-like protein